MLTESRVKILLIAHVRSGEYEVSHQQHVAEKYNLYLSDLSVAWLSDVFLQAAFPC